MKGHVCPWWFSYAFDNPLRKLFHVQPRLLAPYVRPGMTCVDLGCGRGYFSLGLARLAGPAGRVFAVDRQQKMLGLLARRAARAGLEGIIQTHLAGPQGLGLERLNGQVDFILCFWMLHEVKARAKFLAQAAALLKPGGRLLLTEPRVHVSLLNFAQSLEVASRTGLEVEARPKVALSRCALLRQP